MVSNNTTMSPNHCNPNHVAPLHNVAHTNNHQHQFYSSASNRIIYAKDHASIGLALAELDDQGHVTGTNKTLNICGEIRKMGESDDSINRLAKEQGIL